jgi:hypothetical protein
MMGLPKFRFNGENNQRGLKRQWKSGGNFLAATGMPPKACRPDAIRTPRADKKRARSAGPFSEIL